MGVFDAAVPSLEALVRRILTAVAKLAVYPREFIFSSMDFTESLTWAPGHFGPSPPWFVDLSFIHMGTTSQHTLLPLFTFRSLAFEELADSSWAIAFLDNYSALASFTCAIVACPV